jgi:predicted nucleic acid-binding protein
MRRNATFDSSFWVHAVYLDLIDFLLADFALICTTAVARELGRDNPTSLRLQALLIEHTIHTANPRSETISLYGDGERAAINLALERDILLFIDDWRPYEAARVAGVAVVNSLAYLVQLYAQRRVSSARVVRDLGRMARRGTVRPTWLQSALTMVAEIHKQGETP